MEKRQSNRMIVSLEAELISGGKSYAGFVENLSDKGIFMKIYSTSTVIDFIPGATPELKFLLPSGEKLNLHCEIKWLHVDKTPSHGFTSCMGLEIINPSQKYREFINARK